MPVRRNVLKGHYVGTFLFHFVEMVFAMPVAGMLFKAILTSHLEMALDVVTLERLLLFLRK